MKTIRYEIFDLETVANLLKDGKVVAFPTDTVYGVGVIYGNEAALQALKESKKRPDNKPIPTMVSSEAQIREVAHVNKYEAALIEEFLPGALTLILRKRSAVPSYVTNGLDTIAIRMPDDDAILHLIDLVERPLLVSSANLSGEDTGDDEDEVLEQLDGRIDAIVVGETKGHKPSTIVDIRDGNLKILRDGAISARRIKAVLKNID